MLNKKFLKISLLLSAMLFNASFSANAGTVKPDQEEAKQTIGKMGEPEGSRLNGGWTSCGYGRPPCPNGQQCWDNLCQ